MAKRTVETRTALVPRGARATVPHQTQQRQAPRNQARPAPARAEAPDAAARARAFDATVEAGVRLSGERGLEGWDERDLVGAGGDGWVLRNRRDELMKAIRARVAELHAA